MGNLGLAEPGGQLHPKVQEHLEVSRPVQMLLDELRKRLPFDPAHLQDGKTLAGDEDALLQVLEANGEGKSGLIQVGGDASGSALGARGLGG